jgi:nitrogenase molybdenum-iron protein NifN
MTEILKRNKALSVNPLKSSQPVGAALAFMGLSRAIPILHGSQGCTAFAKVFFVRHFREPIPMQTTAMDQVSAIMGADENVIEALNTVCEKTGADVIGLLSTGLSEIQGADIDRLVKDFRKCYPQHQSVSVVPVNTPDFSGCLETGYAMAVKAMIEVLVPDKKVDMRPSEPGHSRVNVLPSSMLTPGDLEAIKEIIEAFGLHPVVIPDLSESLDGHLDSNDFSPTSTGGTKVSDFAHSSEALATLVVGASLNEAAKILSKRSGVPSIYFTHLMDLQAVDGLVNTLHEISGKPVPAKLERQRAQLQDAMLDTHFSLGQARIAIAADPDLLFGFSKLARAMGAEVVTAVTPMYSDILGKMPVKTLKIGDLQDLQDMARVSQPELIIGNSHAADTAQRLAVPLLRAGFPLYDLIGGHQRTWIGYRGIRQALFDMANLLDRQRHHHRIKPYVSVYAQKSKSLEVSNHELATPSAVSEQRA